MKDQDHPTEIARLKAQVALLEAELAKERGIIAGRQPLSRLRDTRGNFNIGGKNAGKAPAGYILLHSPKLPDAIGKLKVPHAQAVRYEKDAVLGSDWRTVKCGYLVQQEDAGTVAVLAQELESGR